jgi:predicted negative regulator of RcsB-dependent stress response
MEQYTDDERVEDLKRWWKENGTSIIAGIGLGLVAIFGWQYWGSYRNAKAEQASQAYDAFVVAVEKPDADQARQRGQALLTDFPKSPYTTLAALRLAKLASDGGDTATAIQRLEWVIENAKLDELKDIARLRLARALFAAGRPSDAEQQLARVTTPSLTAEREELRGDLALAGNDPAKARTAYAAALAASGGNSLLQLKLDNLTPPTANSVIAAPTAPPAPVQPEPTKPESAPPLAIPAPQAVPPTEPAAPATPMVGSSQTPTESATSPVAAAPTPTPTPPTADATPAPATDSGTVPAPTTPAPTSGQ